MTDTNTNLPAVQTAQPGGGIAVRSPGRTMTAEPAANGDVAVIQAHTGLTVLR